MRGVVINFFKDFIILEIDKLYYDEIYMDENCEWLLILTEAFDLFDRNYENYGLILAIYKLITQHKLQLNKIFNLNESSDDAFLFYIPNKMNFLLISQ